MKVALVGAHGTGKTTVFNDIKKRKTNWIYVTEATRRTVPKLGYRDPWDVINEFGIAFYESMIMSQWCVLDPSANPLINKEQIWLLDRSPVDNLAYYYLVRSTDEIRYEKILFDLCSHFSSLIDHFLVFPVGVFPCITDDMRKSDLQYEHNSILIKLINDLSLSFYFIEEHSVQERIEEVINYIEKENNNETII